MSGSEQRRRAVDVLDDADHGNRGEVGSTLGVVPTLRRDPLLQLWVQAPMFQRSRRALRRILRGQASGRLSVLGLGCLGIGDLGLGWHFVTTPASLVRRNKESAMGSQSKARGRGRETRAVTADAVTDMETAVCLLCDSPISVDSVRLVLGRNGAVCRPCIEIRVPKDWGVGTIEAALKRVDAK